jgi:hypothetical protein
VFSGLPFDPMGPLHFEPFGVKNVKRFICVLLFLSIIVASLSTLNAQ